MADIHDVANNLIEAATKASAKVADAAGAGSSDIRNVEAHLALVERATATLKMINESGVAL